MKLNSLVESLNLTGEEIVITKNGRPTAVLISLDEYESFQETEAIRSDDELIKEIREGLKDSDRKIYTLAELFQ